MSGPLASRLACLVRQSGHRFGGDATDDGPSVKAAPPDSSEAGATAEAAVDEWAARVGQLRELARGREVARRFAAASLPGERVAPGVRRIESCLPVRADARAEMTAAPTWEPAVAIDGPVIFLDTETSGLAGGTGTFVFLLGLAQLTDAGLRVAQWLLESPAAEPAFYDAVRATLPARAVLVSYNGRSFDLPLLSARFRLVRQPDPFRSWPHWDLLAPMRRAFGRRWPDCRLQTAESRLLGETRVDDLGGAFAPAAWVEWLRHGRAALLQRIVRHNRDDLSGLPRLLAALHAVHADPERHDADAGALANRLLALGRRDQARALLARCRPPERSARHLRARLALEAGCAEEARCEWESLHAAGDREATRRLIVYWERHAGDLARALELAEALAAAEPDEPRHRRRVDRLHRRLGRGGYSRRGCGAGPAAPSNGARPWRDPAAFP